MSRRYTSGQLASCISNSSTITDGYNQPVAMCTATPRRRFNASRSSESAHQSFASSAMAVLKASRVVEHMIRRVSRFSHDLSCLEDRLIPLVQGGSPHLFLEVRVIRHAHYRPAPALVRVIRHASRPIIDTGAAPLFVWAVRGGVSTLTGNQMPAHVTDLLYAAV